MSYKKYYIYKEQYSNDGGQTWIDTGNETASGNPIGTYDTLAECEGLGTFRFRIKKTDSSEVYSYCDGAYSANTQVTQSEIRTLMGGTSSSNEWVDQIKEIEFGTCTTLSGVSNNIFPITANTSITSATIANGSITHIGTSAFAGLNGLESFVIPDNITSMDGGVFGLSGLKYVTIGRGLTTIPSGTFASSSLRTVTIPSGITSIGDLAFRACTGLTTVTFEGDGVTSIGDGAFKTCYALRSFEMPSGVTVINDSTFANCVALTDFNLKQVHTIDRGGFSGCTNLKEINLSGVTSLGDSAFSGCTTLSSVTLSDELRIIGHSTFNKCTSLSAVTLPNSVTGISETAFANCSALTSINLSNMDEIEKQAFSNCNALTSISLDNIYEIGIGAFQSCSALTDVTIGSGCVSIGSSAFDSVNAAASSQTFTVLATVPPTLGGNFVTSSGRLNAIYVPDESVDAYKSALNWMTYASKIKPISEKP